MAGEERQQKTLELGKVEDGTNQSKSLDNSRHTALTTTCLVIRHTH